MFKILGTDDAYNTCDCCGKTNLKSTVIVDMNGEILHYGSVCATRHTKLTDSEIKAAIKAEQDRRFDVANKEYETSQEYIAYENKVKEAYRLNVPVGKVFKNFVQDEYDVARAKWKEIFGKHGLA